jgi:hypothetical protein
MTGAAPRSYTGMQNLYYQGAINQILQGHAGIMMVRFVVCLW